MTIRWFGLLDISKAADGLEGVTLPTGKHIPAPVKPLPPLFKLRGPHVGFRDPIPRVTITVTERITSAPAKEEVDYRCTRLSVMDHNWLPLHHAWNPRIVPKGMWVFECFHDKTCKKGYVIVIDNKPILPQETVPRCIELLEYLGIKEATLSAAHPRIEEYKFRRIKYMDDYVMANKLLSECINRASAHKRNTGLPEWVKG